ncbi:MAG: hypothetical protein ISS78_05525 [Phycisphaerae bacterium]|nr:hypothetical protein [Phycisphaerae bacterium]
MTLRGNVAADTSNVAALEDGLAATLAETYREVAHAECFDPEQRAEIYTILEILKADTDVHRETIGRYVGERGSKDAGA